MRTALLILAVIVLRAVSMAQESPHGPLKIACEACHSTDSWKMARKPAFDHASTGFALMGQHRAVACKACHADLKFSAASSSCNSCHADIHKSELGDNCLRCHSNQSWKISDMVQKHQQTRFTLLGKHATVACEACHASASNFQYKGVSATCIGCHRQDYQMTSNPAHSDAGFSTACATCHLVTALVWDQSFDHNLTAFPLTGAHRASPCSNCHGDRVFKGKPTQCVGCHQTDFNAAVNPDHLHGGFPTNCMQCHTTTAWQPATFQHNATNFPLTGKHQTVRCQSCHINNNYTLTYSGCYQCHQPDYQGAANPNHAAANYSHTCQTCHSTTSWSGASFDHSTTRFALTGKHTTAQCQDCHVNNNYQLTYSSCYQCHQSNFEANTNPNHVAGNFSHTCQTCHSTTSWSGATFDHNTTNFPLTGKHTTTLCADCHVNNNYQLTYSSCYQCHQSNYEATTNPAHATLNFSHDCQTCHTTAAWIPSTFNHDQQYFKIYTGRHYQQWTLCTDCHTNTTNYAVYSCLNCHVHAQSVMDPKHSQVSGYSYTSAACYSCHRRV